jgi:hypothetical protein
VTTVADAEGRPPEADGRSRVRTTEWQRPTWPRLVVIGAILVLAFVYSRSCQQSQTRVTKEQAVAIAEKQVDFEPEQTQVRFLRQGLGSKPFWFVVLSVPTRKDENAFSKVAQIRVDANTGEVEELTPEDAQRPRKQRETQR